jgi:hypothetical protein
MNELQQLVRRFVSGELNYRQFRQEFGPFFSRSDVEPVLSRVCEWIESECSAFEHGIIDDAGLRLGFNMNIAWAGIQPRNVPNPIRGIKIDSAHLGIAPNEARNDVARVHVHARVA